MAREPSYPEEAAVDPAPEESESGESVGAAAAAARAVDPRRTSHLVAGAAIGIGSAALVAALLYANRSRRGGSGGDKGGNG